MGLEIRVERRLGLSEPCKDAVAARMDAEGLGPRLPKWGAAWLILVSLGWGERRHGEAGSGHVIRAWKQETLLPG